MDNGFIIILTIQNILILLNLFNYFVKQLKIRKKWNKEFK